MAIGFRYRLDRRPLQTCVQPALAQGGMYCVQPARAHGGYRHWMICSRLAKFLFKRILSGDCFGTEQHS